jgi:hypothetical protein
VNTCHTSDQDVIHRTGVTSDDQRLLGHLDQHRLILGDESFSIEPQRIGLHWYKQVFLEGSGLLSTFRALCIIRSSTAELKVAHYLLDRLLNQIRPVSTLDRVAGEAVRYWKNTKVRSAPPFSH